MARNYAYAEAEGLVSVFAQFPTRSDILTLEHDPGENSRWWYFANSVCTRNSATADLVLFLEQATLVADLGGVNTELNDLSCNPCLFWGAEVQYAASGSQTIKLQGSGEGTGVNMSCRWNHLLAIEALADDFFEGDDATAANTSATYATALTFNETLSGDYLFLCFCEFNIPSTSARFNIRADKDGTKYGASRLSMPDSGSWRTWGTAFRLDGLAGSQTVTIEFNSENGVTAAAVRRRRIFALKLDEFTALASAENLAADANTTTTPEVQTTLSTSPVSGFEYLILAAMIGSHTDLGSNGHYSVYNVVAAADILNWTDEPNTADDAAPGMVFKVASFLAAVTYETYKWSEIGATTTTALGSLIAIMNLEDLPSAVSHFGMGKRFHGVH